MNTRISPSAVDAGKLKEDALTTRWLPRFWTPFHRFQIVKYQCIFKKGQEKQKESKCQSKTMSIEVEILPKWAQSQPTKANPKWGEYSDKNPCSWNKPQILAEYLLRARSWLCKYQVCQTTAQPFVLLCLTGYACGFPCGIPLLVLWLKCTFILMDRRY